jgi:hypothetical protein
MKQLIVQLMHTVESLLHARAVEAQKPRNTHKAIEVRVFIARRWVTHATVERVVAPRPPLLLLRNAEVNTSLRQLVATQQ